MNSKSFISDLTIKIRLDVCLMLVGGTVSSRG